MGAMGTPLLAALGSAVAVLALLASALAWRARRLQQALAQAREQVDAGRAELRRSQADAEAASRAKSDFLANIGHEIRTPMNTVLGQTHLLLAGRLQAAQRSQLQEVAQAGESLVKLIDSLLDYVDLDAGRMPLAAEPVRLETLLADAFDAVRPAAQAKHLELLCEIAAPELLGGAGARRGDAARLTQLLTELLVNAVKFTPAGQVQLTAGLSADGAWLLRVRDSGLGMPPEQLARLFTPFAQAEAGATRRFGGVGLGLAICRSLTHRMGGTLSATSTPGRGSSFELQLPLPPCPELALPATPQARSVLLVQAPHSAGHDSLLGLLKALAPGARVEVLPQGRLGLNRLAGTPASQPHDLLLVDWVLPDMEGSELLRQLAEAGPPRAQRIVLLSAFDTPVLRERALRQGAHALVPKPLLPDMLRRLLALDSPLPVMQAVPLPGNEDSGPATDTASLISELDTLLGDADAQALALWEQHSSAFMDTLPGPQAQALAGAMQRFDFDEAQAALRGKKAP
jgi:signal transduction histidine kinase/CheY-like chemotaxis protein